MTITIKELNEKIILINTIDLSINDKLTYIVNKFKSRILRATKDTIDIFNESLEDVRIDLCDKDEKGLIVLDNNGHRQFKNPENLKSLSIRTREFSKVYESTNIDFEPYIFTDSKSDIRVQNLDLFLIEELTGFIF